MATNKTKAEQSEHLKNLEDEDISTSDIPAITDFTGFEQNLFVRPVKVTLSVKIDADLFMWLKTHDEMSIIVNQLLRDKMFQDRANANTSIK